MATVMEPSPLNHIQPPEPSHLSHLLNTRCHRSLHLLRETHAQLIKRGLTADNYIAGTLLKHYANPNLPTFHTALKVFDQMPQPHVFLWNALIRACLDNGKPHRAISSYSLMLTQGSLPNKYTFPSLFNACTAAGAVKAGVQLHAHLLKRGFGRDRYSVSTGIRMYAASGMVAEARRMLDSAVAVLDTACWNTMIDGFMKNGEVDAAKNLFDEMPGRNVGSWNTMISGYARNGMIGDSRKLFDEMPERDEVSWSALIDGYVQCGQFKDALVVFRRMLTEGVAPKDFVFPSVLAACANAGALEQGRWLHAYIERESIKIDAVLGAALIDMYAKCGSIELALEVFQKILSKKVFSWNAMIGGLAIHGHARRAIELFQQMRKEGFKPDNITFVGLLNACAHAGFVEEGRKYFSSMKRDYKITPTVEHYGCLVDLLGRAGRFEEAEELIGTMTVKPSSAVWGALLGACRIHGNVDLGERVGKALLELEPENSGRYTLLSNIYASAGRWEDVVKVRKLMKDREIKTIPGCSLVELDGIVHEFVVGDSSHPKSKEIHQMLEEMLGRLRLGGYVSNSSQVLFDIDEEEKDSVLSYHSEKLAIAFGLLNTVPGAAIRIIKNLRVCEDCHSAAKLISLLYCREIVIRDRVRYHHFKDGICSCMDYW